MSINHQLHHQTNQDRQLNISSLRSKDLFSHFEKALLMKFDSNIYPSVQLNRCVQLNMRRTSAPGKSRYVCSDFSNSV